MSKQHLIETPTAFVSPGSTQELDFEPLPEQAAARRKLVLTITADEIGKVAWQGDPLLSIMDVYGFPRDANVPPTPLGTGPTRWLTSAISAVDSPSPFLMDESPEPPPVTQIDRAQRIARRLAGLAGVDHVKVVWLPGIRRDADSTEQYAA